MSENSQAQTPWVAYDLKKLSVGAQVEMIFSTSIVDETTLQEVRNATPLDYLTSVGDNTVLMLFGREGADQILGALVQANDNKLLDREEAEVCMPALQEAASGLVFYTLNRAPHQDISQPPKEEQIVDRRLPTWVFLQLDQLPEKPVIELWHDLQETNGTREVTMGEHASAHTFEDGARLYLFKKEDSKSLFAILVDKNNLQVVGQAVNGYFDAFQGRWPKDAVVYSSDRSPGQDQQLFQSVPGAQGVPEGATLYHTFEDGTEMWVGGADMHPTGAFYRDPQNRKLTEPGRYSELERQIKAAGKSMTPVRDAQEAAAKATIKPKYAIAIPAWQRFVSRDQWTPKLLDRNGPKDFCEKDPSHLQLLVYIAIKDPQGFIFSYKRGSAGTEDRLHDLRSIGLGGHADEPMKEGQDLTSYLAEHAVRETEEEVGWTPNMEVMKEAIDKAFLIYMPKNEVDRVHMALAVTLHVPDRSLLEKLEEGQIEEPAWLDPTYAQLQLTLATLVKPEALAWQFETWSEVYLKVTRSPADEMRYRQGMANLQMAFTMHRHAKQLFEQKVDPNIKGSPRLRIAVDMGVYMEVDLNGDGQWKRVKNGPFSVLIDSVRDGELPGTEPTAPRLRAYTFYSEVAQTGYTTVDFVHWQELDFNAPQVGDLQAQNEPA